MRINYRHKETILDKIEEAISKACKDGNLIDSIELNDHEFYSLKAIISQKRHPQSISDNGASIWVNGVKVYNQRAYSE